MKKGFTLTELLIVVSIIAFLTVLIAVYLRTQIFKANDAKRKTDLNRIGIALEEYEKDNDCYPLPNLVVCEPNSGGLMPYLNNIPCDPISKTSYYYETDGNITCPKWYRLYASLENEKDNDYLSGIGQGSFYSYYQSSPNAPTLDTGGGEEETMTWGCFSGVCRIRQNGCSPSFVNNSCGGSGCVDGEGNHRNECN